MKKIVITLAIILFISTPSFDIDTLNRLTVNKLEVFINNSSIINI